MPDKLFECLAVTSPNTQILLWSLNSHSFSHLSSLATVSSAPSPLPGFLSKQTFFKISLWFRLTEDRLFESWFHDDFFREMHIFSVKIWKKKSFFFHIFLLGKARGSEGGRCLCILKVVSIEYINIVRYFSSLLSLLLWIQLWCQPSSPPFAILKGLMLQSRISE